MAALTVGRHGLVSLAQLARRVQLRSGRWLLWFIGVVWAIFGLMMLAMAGSVADAVVESRNAIPRQVGRSSADDRETQQIAGQMRARVTLVGGAISVAGVCFIVLGALIYRHPVPVTVTGLVLYIAMQLAMVVINPASLLDLWIVRLIFAFGLARCVASAIAYRRAEKAALLQSQAFDARPPQEQLS